MNKPTRIYLLLVVLVACFLVARQPWANLLEMTSDQWLALTTFVVLGTLSEILAVSYKIGSGTASSSIAFVPLLASIVLFPRPVALGLGLIIYSGAELVIHRRTAIKASFNTGQVAIALIVASLVYESLGGLPGDTKSLSVLNFSALAGTFFFTNQFLVTIAVALIQREDVGRTFAKIVSVSGSNLFYDALISPIAVIVVLVYSQWQLAGLLVASLPLLLLRHSYLANHRLQQTNRDLLRVLVKVIETRDPYTSGHSVRVSVLAKAIAEDLGLRKSRVAEIETAALVHDIGKVDSIYAEIIQKDSSLTEAEKRVIVTHAAKGAEFLRTLTSFREYVIAAVRHHHERYDGSGYPDRLVGEAIPLPARIIMICDSIDAMLSDRPYRSALTVPQVRAELLRCAGTQFDPAIVNVILQRGTLERAAELAAPTPRPVPHLSVAV